VSLLEHLVDTPLAAALGYALLQFLWQGALIALLLAIALRLQSARVRYAVACAALALMPVVFAVTVWWSLPAASPALSPPAAHRVSLLAHGMGGTGLVLTSWSSRLPWLAPCWMAGVLLLWSRALVSWAMVQRLRRVGVCAAAPEWHERLVQIQQRLRMSCLVLLMESCLAEVPATIGFFRPVILMPLGLLAGIPPGHVEAFLIHELAHIRRCDYLVNLAQTFVESLLFYHPAVWWVSATVRAERESCCDDAVVALTGDAPAYAAALSTIEERRCAAAAALAANGGPLMKRIRRLLGHDRPRATAAPLIGLLLVPACLVLGAWHSMPSKSVALQIVQGPAPKPDVRAQVSPAGLIPQFEALWASQQAPAKRPIPPRREPVNRGNLEKMDRLLAQVRAAAPPSPYQKWLEEDVAYIITPQEKDGFSGLQTDAERQQFIVQFWQRRDPTPGTPRNEFQEEHYRRIGYANDHFGFDATAGWRTDRGRIYIEFGPPDERGVFEKGGTDADGKPTALPFERWRYRYIQGIGNDVFMEFVDEARTGNYQMTKNPAGPDAGQRFVPAPNPN